MSLEKEPADHAGLRDDDDDDQDQDQDTSRAASKEDGDGDAVDSPAVALKTSEILAACTWRDATRLRALAESEGGLLADSLRRAACTCLCQCAPRFSSDRVLTARTRVYRAYSARSVSPC